MQDLLNSPSRFEVDMEKSNSILSGDHDEIAVTKGPGSKPYSVSEPNEKADDEVSVRYLSSSSACETVVHLDCTYRLCSEAMRD